MYAVIERDAHRVNAIAIFTVLNEAIKWYGQRCEHYYSEALGIEMDEAGYKEHSTEAPDYQARFKINDDEVALEVSVSVGLDVVLS
jgi:hypothetical protein